MEIVGITEASYSFLLQKKEFCRRFQLNGTMPLDCAGTYSNTGQACGGYPFYEKSDGSTWKVIIYHYGTGKWFCGAELPRQGCWFINHASSIEVRKSVIGPWENNSAYATCLD